MIYCRILTLLDRLHPQPLDQHGAELETSVAVAFALDRIHIHRIRYFQIAAFLHKPTRNLGSWLVGVFFSSSSPCRVNKKKFAYTNNCTSTTMCMCRLFAISPTRSLSI